MLYKLSCLKHSILIIPASLLALVITMISLLFRLSFSLLFISSVSTQAAVISQEQFIQNMMQHGFTANSVRNLLAKAKLKNSIIKAMNRPGEAKPWYEYRKIFIKPSRIRGGVHFMQQHHQLLQAAQQRYGVPAEIITAIIGVETIYGKNTGSFRVLDALYTLAFHYPKRADFFRSELEKFLIMTRQEGINPLTPKGSYAGAMGLGQFMPSSFLRYAVDFDGDGKRKLWEITDSIGSVANYLKAFGWQTGQPIILATQVQADKADSLLELGLKPKYSLQTLQQRGLRFTGRLPSNTLGSLVMLKTELGKAYWLALDNFYVITRYNHSRRYAMAVTQLAEAIHHQTIVGRLQ